MLRHVDHEFIITVGVHFSAVRAFQSEHVSGELYDGRLQPETNSQHGFLRLPAPLARFDLAFDASLTETTRNYNSTVRYWKGMLKYVFWLAQPSPPISNGSIISTFILLPYGKRQVKTIIWEIINCFNASCLKGTVPRVVLSYQGNQWEISLI